MAERDSEAVLRFVEHFASSLVEAGVPRMPARVLAALYASDSGRLNAAELAGMLGVSPAAVSGAVRYLSQLSLIRREREPGSRRDWYVVDNDIWYEATINRDRLLLRWEASIREGITALGADSPAGRRLNETLAFLEFLRGETPQLLERWQKIKTELRAASPE